MIYHSLVLPGMVRAARPALKRALDAQLGDFAEAASYLFTKTAIRGLFPDHLLEMLRVARTLHLHL